MIKIYTRRYYLSEFMYDNYKDNPTNLYNGFFVDVMPDLNNDKFNEFWLGHDNYTYREFMFGICNHDCDTDMGALNLIERNVREYVDAFVDKHFDDCGCKHCDCDCDCCCDCDDEFVESYDDVIFEAIDMHNEHVDKIEALAETLLDVYPDVDDTPVDKAFTDAFNSMIGQAILLCCEANCIDDGCWMTTDDWHVVRNEDVED